MDKQKHTTAGAADYPVPDDAALRLSRVLADRIHEEISRNGGHISFHRYMEMALYEPGLGYYSAGSRKFGAGGDFTTAPEISSLFSACVARQCEQVLRQTGPGVVLELGAGTGVMASDILVELRRRDSLPEHYLILETSADLRARQQQLLRERVPELFHRVVWLTELPRSLQGVILANEVLDAIPVHRVKVEEGALRELMVTHAGESFGWCTGPLDGAIADVIAGVLPDRETGLNDGYITEFNSLLHPYIGTLAATLVRGTMLFIDYGYPRHEYYHPERTNGTLVCHYRHRRHDDPFMYVGLQDISVSVDFTQLAECGLEAGLRLAGFTTQSGFLISCGLVDIIREYQGDDQRKQLHYSSEAAQLVLPGGMGELFKVMALSRGMDFPMLGFRFADHSPRLGVTV